MPPRAVVAWSKMKPPSTAQQRIAFLDACQREFETIRVVGAVSEQLAVARRGGDGEECADEEGAAGEDGATSSTYTAMDDAPFPLPPRSRCAACGGRGGVTRAATANPFADWNVLFCGNC
jgi:hypothetical protein